MVDFRTSGVTSSRKYSPSGSSRSGGGRSERFTLAESKKKNRLAARAAAFAKPATGQWQPGALSAADPRTTSSLADPTPSQYPFVTRNGQSGQLVPQQSSALLSQTDVSSMSPAFAEKLRQSQMSSQANAEQGSAGIGGPDLLAQQFEGFGDQAMPVSQPGQAQGQPDRGLLGDIGLGGLRDKITEGVRKEMAATIGIGGKEGDLQTFASAGIGTGAIMRSAGGAISRFGGITKTMAAAKLGDKGAIAIMKQVKAYNIAAKNAAAGLAKSPLVKFAGQKTASAAITNKLAGITSVPGKLPPARGVTVKAQSIWNRLVSKQITNTKTVQTVDVGTGIASATQYTTTQDVARFSGKGAKIAKWTLAAVLAGSLYAIGSVGFSLFQKAEALDKAKGAQFVIKNIAEDMGLQAEDYESYLDARQLEDDVQNTQITLLNSLGFKGTRLNIETARKANAIIDTAMEDRAMATENGETEEMMWQRINIQKALQHKENVDYENSTRLMTVQAELQLRADARTTTTANERANMIAQAEFWLSYRKKLMKLAEEERIKQAEFWLEYNKMQMKLSEESRPSKLNFGLLR